MAVDDVLLLYGETKRRALRAYRAAMSAVEEEEWSGGEPGHLPWWKLGRPTDEDRALRRSGAHIDEQGRGTARWRPRYGARQWLDLTSSHLGADPEAFGGRGRSAEVVWQRDLIGPVGIERYGVKVTELAAELGKSRDGVSRWYRRGTRRRLTDPEFAAAVVALDEVASEGP